MADKFKDQHEELYGYKCTHMEAFNTLLVRQMKGSTYNETENESRG